MLHSCGIIPIRVISGKSQYLLLANHSHWDFPKGCVEGDETKLACALREFSEETGVDPIFDWGPEPDKFYETEPYSKPKKIARYYVAQLKGQPIVKLMPNPKTGLIEHNDFGWFSYVDAVALVKPRILKALEFAYKIVEAANG